MKALRRYMSGSNFFQICVTVILFLFFCLPSRCLHKKCRRLKTKAEYKQEDTNFLHKIPLLFIAITISNVIEGENMSFLWKHFRESISFPFPPGAQTDIPLQISEPCSLMASCASSDRPSSLSARFRMGR